jgi:hypothetical protein
MVETHLSLTTPVDCMFYLGFMCAFLLPTSSTGTRSYIENNVVQAHKKTMRWEIKTKIKSKKPYLPCPFLKSIV